MKSFKLILLLLLIPCIAIPCIANAGMVIGSGTIGGGSCPTSETLILDKLSTDSYVDAGLTVNKEYRGQASFAPATDLGGTKTICSVGFGFRQTVGDVSAVDWQVEIYEMSSVNLGSAPTGTCVSSTRKITGEYPIGELKFTGLSCSLESGKTYGIALIRTDHSYDGTNYVQFNIATTSSHTGYLAAWEHSDNARTDDDSGFDVSMRLYGF